jgi:hypothetical protein
MHQSYVYKLWYSKNRNLWEEKNFSKKESEKEEEPQLNRSMISEPPCGGRLDGLVILRARECQNDFALGKDHLKWTLSLSEIVKETLEIWYILLSMLNVVLNVI